MDRSAFLISTMVIAVSAFTLIVTSPPAWFLWWALLIVLALHVGRLGLATRASRSEVSPTEVWARKVLRIKHQAV